ncbi:aldehyde reductase [uncultured Microscilla sp.]|uniref:SDR family oxidoreductase n=1 Tax=uncultured Microscilla sp. TaxID=432653 RepID=UPI00261DD9CA|nr:aldehyde reductase [uncultured Microscilla sp.]
MDKSNTKVLVTGITGFIGSHIAIQLLNEGYQVRGSLRNTQRIASIKEVIAQYTSHIDNLSFVEAELTQAQSWDAATQGVDYVQHVASPLSASLPKHEDELIVPAKEGAENVLQAAIKNGVKRVVMTSSVAAIGYGNMKGNTTKAYTEAHWTDIQDRKDTTPYIRSKTIAEKAAWQVMEANDTTMELVTIQPVAVMGPVLEKDYGTSAELVKKLLDGDFPGAPKFGFSVVDVRDVADLQIKAMEQPEAAGQRFICNAGFHWVSEIAEIMREKYPQYKKRMPKFSLPNFAVRLFGMFDPATRSVMNELGKKRVFDNSKAINMLDWQPRNTQEALLATADSLIEQGLIK